MEFYEYEALLKFQKKLKKDGLKMRDRGNTLLQKHAAKPQTVGFRRAMWLKGEADGLICTAENLEELLQELLDLFSEEVQDRFK